MPLTTNDFTNIEHRSYVEQAWRWMTKRIISSTDTSDQVMRKVPCLVFGAAFIYGGVGLYYAYQASQKETGTPEHAALVATAIPLTLWGFLVALPTLVYVIVTKDAPVWLTTYILWATTFLSLIVDTFATYYYAHVAYLGLTAFSMTANLPSAPHHAVFHFLLVLMNSIRDSTDLPLRYNHPFPYQGTLAEALLFKVAGLIFMVTVPLALQVANWEQEKILNAAKFNIAVSQEVAEHVLAYDTDSITKTLESVSADIVIDEETNETQPSIVSKDLVEAFRKIQKNLETWKPLLPEWCFPKDDIDESIDLYALSKASRNDDDDDDDSESSSPGRRKSGAYVSIDSHNTSTTEDSKLGSTGPAPKQGGRFQAVDKRSWEGGSDNSGSDSHEMANKQQQSAAPQQAMLLKGSFLNRVIVCRLNLSRLPSFLISTYQQRNKASKKFMANTSTRFNRIMEILLETANSENGTVHTFFSDFVFVSFNATTRSSHTDIKAMRFLTTLESAVRKELTNFAGDIAKENAGLRVQELNNSSSNATRSDSGLQLPVVDDKPTDTSSTPLTPITTQPNTDTVITSKGSSVPVSAKSVLDQLTSNGRAHSRIITGAAVFGSCFGQIGGNMKRQQFILSSFSNQASFKQACAVGDKCGFVAVCKTLHHNTQQEYDFRGCSIILPSQYKGMIKYRSTSESNNKPMNSTPNHQSTPGKKSISNNKENNSVNDDVADGNLCHAVVNTKNNNNNNNDDGGDRKSSLCAIEQLTLGLDRYTVELSPLYELVAPKNMNAKGDDAWLYAISSTSNSGLPGHKLNDAILSLCKLAADEAATTLEQMAKDDEKVVELPSYKMLKTMIPVVQMIKDTEENSGKSLRDAS